MKRINGVFIIFMLCSVLLQGCMGRSAPLSEYTGGEFIGATDSPNGRYTISAYIYRGSATESDTVRAELIDNDNDLQKNIYLQYRKRSVRCEWIDDVTVNINGIILDVTCDTYDWRDNE